MVDKKHCSQTHQAPGRGATVGTKFRTSPLQNPSQGFCSCSRDTAATTTLDANEADDIRMRTCGILRKAKTIMANLSRQQKIVIDELRQMEGVVILPADKGNATVLMAREEYDNKLERLLNTNTYKILKKDPTAAQETKIGRILREYVKKDEISDGLYNQLRSSGCQPHRIDQSDEDLTYSQTRINL